jgi:hypothetical protein
LVKIPQTNVLFFILVGIIDPSPSPVIESEEQANASSGAPRVSGVFHKDSNSINLLDGTEEGGKVTTIAPGGTGKNKIIQGVFPGNVKNRKRQRTINPLTFFSTLEHMCS